MQKNLCQYFFTSYEEHISKHFGNNMPTNFNRKSLYLFTTLICLSSGTLQATSGAWNQAVGGNWNEGTNWTNGAFPNAAGEVAGFVGNPLTSSVTPYEIGTLAPAPTSITIGTLHIDTYISPPLNPPRINITLSDGTNQSSLLFSPNGSSTTNASIYFGGSIGQSNEISCPILLAQGNLDLYGSVSSSSLPELVISNSLSIASVRNSLSVISGRLRFGGNLQLLGGTSIPSLYVGQQGQFMPTVNNVFTPLALGADITLDGQANQNFPLFIPNFNFDLNGTRQNIHSIVIQHGAVFGDSQLGGLGPGRVSVLNTLSMSSGVYSIADTTFSTTTGPASIIYQSLFINEGQARIGDPLVATRITLPLNADLEIAVNPPVSVPFSLGNQTYDLQALNVTFSKNPASVVPTQLVKTGSGTLLLEGIPAIIPKMTVNNGTVLLGLSPSEIVSATGDLTVNSPGILAGIGTTTIGKDGNTLINNGTVAPGTPEVIGTLTLDLGNYTQTSNGTLLIKGNSTASADQLVVLHDNVSLDGTLIFQAQPNSTFSAGDQVVVIDNTGGLGVSGTFSNFLPNIPNNLSAKVQYDPNQVLILFSSCSGGGPCPPCPIIIPLPPSMTNYINLREISLMLANQNFLDLSHRLRKVRARFEVSFSEPQESVAALDAHSDALIASGDNSFLAASFSKEEQIDVSRFRKDRSQQPLSIYIAPLASSGELDRIRSQNEVDFSSAGVLAGSDYAFSRAGVGLQVGYEKLHGKVHEDWGNFDIKALFGSFYGSFLPFGTRHFFFDLSLGGGRNWYDIHRHIDHQNAKGDPSGWEWDAYAGIGYDVKRNNFRFTPLLAFDYVGLTVDAYREHGGGDLDVKVKHQTFHSCRSWLGFSVGGTYAFRPAITFLPEFRAYWQHDFAETNKHIHIASTEFGTTSRLQIFGGGQDYGVVGGQIQGLFGKHLNLTASYDYNWNQKLSANLFYGEIGYNF